MQPIHLMIEKLLLKVPKLSAFSALVLYAFWIGICSWTKLNLLGAALLAYVLTTDRPKYWAILAHTFHRDIKVIGMYLRFKYLMFRFVRYDTNVVTCFMKCLKKNPEKPCIVFEDEIWTYTRVNEYCNRVADLFRRLGYNRGDVVSLIMDNRPEYIGIWLGLAKLGVVTALTNYNLKQQSLLHSIKVAEAKAVIFSSEFTQSVDDVRGSLDGGVKYFVLDDKNGQSFAQSFSPLIQNSSTTEPPPITLNRTDRLIYIYTSGTTGLPKAAVISHLRYYFISMCANLGCNLRENDRFYVPLPIYHSAGGILGTGPAIIFNVTVVLRRRFSASQFWSDCIKYKCTVSQYIGETCRYLLAQPTRPQDTAHSIRALLGNGLRVQMWDEFVSRFRIKELVELYGATEGNANMANIDNTKGAVGFQPRTPKFLIPYMLIRVNEETGEPIRDENGFCIQCPPGEPGELVGRIDKNRHDRMFDGYVNKQDSEKKILRDVFGKNTLAFATGDLLVMDKYGYFYFKDRTGDTFRWKGENVSTAEVEDVIGKSIGLKECTVYGVEIPGNEGRAGMVAIVDPEHSVNLNELAVTLEKSLPSYSRPVFVRITASIPMTSTYKLKKLELQNEAFHPSKCGSDRLYVLNSSGRYQIIDDVLYADICNGKIRL